MDSKFLYLALALISGTGLLSYLLYNKKSPTPKTDTIYTEALNAMIKGEKGKAIRYLRDVVKQDSNHVRAYLQMGNILRDDHPDQATKIHQSLTVRANLPTDLKVDIHQSLALDFEQLEKNTLAKREAEMILKIEKRNLWALRFLLSLAEKEGKWDKAAGWSKLIQKITGKQDKHELSRYIVYKGLDKLKKGLRDDAKAFFQKAIKSAPEQGLPYLYLGDIFEQTRDLVKAIENWESFALRDLKKASQVFSKIETALFDLGRYSEVENFYRKILKNDSTNLEAVIRLANVLEEKGETSAAINLVEESIQPGSRNIRSDLMKLKLSLTTSTPVELSHQIDTILEKLAESIDG